MAKDKPLMRILSGNSGLISHTNTLVYFGYGFMLHIASDVRQLSMFNVDNHCDFKLFQNILNVIQRRDHSHS